MDRFTWFPKFSEALARIPDERMRERFAYAVVMYGSTGELVELSWPLDAIFAACVEDIDNSKQAAQAGAKGGRPRKGQVSQASAAPRECEKPQVCRTENPGFCDSETQGYEKAKAIPYQSIPNQAIPGERRAPETDPLGEPARRGGYPEPTPSEVEAYVAANGGHPISGVDFVGWYRDHGWPKAGWHGSAMRWSRQERDRAACGRASPSGEAARAAAARREAAELGERYGEGARTEVVS